MTTPTAMSAYVSVTAAADFLPLRSFLACSLLDSFLSFTSSCTISAILFSACLKDVLNMQAVADAFNGLSTCLAVETEWPCSKSVEAWTAHHASRD